MKKIITLSCLMLLCSFAGMAQKFALIDMEYILKNIPAYEMTNEQLSQVSKKWQNEVEAIQQEAQNMYKNYRFQKCKAVILFYRVCCLGNSVSSFTVSWV